MPEVISPVFSDVATETTVRSVEETAAVNELRMSSKATLSEVRRLVTDGLRVMTRNVVSWLLADSPELDGDHGVSKLQYPDATTFS